MMIYLIIFKVETLIFNLTFELRAGIPVFDKPRGSYHCCYVYNISMFIFIRGNLGPCFFLMVIFPVKAMADLVR